MVLLAEGHGIVDKAAAVVVYPSESTGKRGEVRDPLSVVPLGCHRHEVLPEWPDKVMAPVMANFGLEEVLRLPQHPGELRDHRLVEDFQHRKLFVVAVVAAAVAEVAAALNMGLVRPIGFVNVRCHLCITHMELTCLE